MVLHQAIHRPSGINVFGSHRIRTEPDYASVSFSVAALHDAPKSALEDCNEATGAVREVLKRFGVPDADVTSSRVSLVLAHDGYGANRKSLGYRATRAYVTLVRELDRIQQLLVELVEAGARELTSVTYQTSDLQALRAEARRGAVRAARAKAEAYADAAGVRVGRAIHIEDVNPETLRQRSHAPDIAIESHGEEAGAGSIVVAGAVMVCFAILE